MYLTVIYFSSECFCGEVEPPQSAKVLDESCDMKCPAEPSHSCGGYFTMNVFETGLASKEEADIML